MSIERGNEQQPTPEEIGRQRLSLLGMDEYADRQAFWNGQEVPSGITIAEHLGAYNDHGVPELFATLENSNIPEAQRQQNRGLLQNAVRFAANEQLES